MGTLAALAQSAHSDRVRQRIMVVSDRPQTILPRQNAMFSLGEMALAWSAKVSAMTLRQVVLSSVLVVSALGTIDLVYRGAGVFAPISILGIVLALGAGLTLLQTRDRTDD